MNFASCLRPNNLTFKGSLNTTRVELPEATKAITELKSVLVHSRPALLLRHRLRAVLPDVEGSSESSSLPSAISTSLTRTISALSKGSSALSMFSAVVGESGGPHGGSLDTEGWFIFVSILVVACSTAFAYSFPAFGQNGYAIAIACAMNCLCMNNVVHYADEKAHLPFGFCLLARTACLTVGAALLGKVRKDPVVFLPEARDIQAMIVLRAVFGFGCILALFFALTRAPVLICLAIFYTNSLWSSCISYLFLGEGLQYAEMGAMAVGVTAVFIIVCSTAHGVETPLGTTSRSQNMVLGIVLALVAAICDAMSAVVNRSCRGRVHHITLMLAQASFGFIASLIGAFVFLDSFMVWPLTPLQLLSTCGVVLSSFMVQLTTNQCYMLEKSGPVQVFINAMVVFPQLGLDLVIGYKHKTSTWFGLLLVLLYLVLFRQAAITKANNSILGRETVDWREHVVIPGSKFTDKGEQ